MLHNLKIQEIQLLGIFEMPQSKNCPRDARRVVLFFYVYRVSTCQISVEGNLVANEKRSFNKVIFGPLKDWNDI